MQRVEQRGECCRKRMLEMAPRQLPMWRAPVGWIPVRSVAIEAMLKILYFQMAELVEGKPEVDDSLTFQQIEDIFLKEIPICPSLREYISTRKVYELYRPLNNYFCQKNENYELKYLHLLQETAEIAHQIIYTLTADSSTFSLCRAYLNMLSTQKDLLREQLDEKSASKMYTYIPTEHIVSFVQLFNVRLTETEKDRLVDEVLFREDICSLLRYWGDLEIIEKALYKLMGDRRFKEAAEIVKSLKVKSSIKDKLQKQLIKVSAATMPRWNEEYTWDCLQEIFHYHPEAIAACINRDLPYNSRNRALIQGYASIRARAPQINHLLRGDVKKMLANETQFLPNKYHSNVFGPSNPVTYFSFHQFGLKEDDVVWVEDVEGALSIICQERKIGIDTESIVARTTIDTSEDVLALVQIATSKRVYLFDAVKLKNMALRIAVMQEYVDDKQNMIIGHTLRGDMGETLKLFGVKNPKCKCLDVQVEFQARYDGKSGLAAICETVLGKPICKAYTMTNWQRRPLFKSQIHYAAMDAFIVLKVWEILEPVELLVRPTKEEKSKARNDRRQRKKGTKKEEEIMTEAP